MDKDLVKSMKNTLNFQNLSCYYDWTSDQDFLKRNLISGYTKEVLKKRIEQSKALILVLTHNVIADGEITSEWIKMEIEHAKSVGKKICCLNFTDLGHQFINIEFQYEGNSISISKNGVQLLTNL